MQHAAVEVLRASRWERIANLVMGAVLALMGLSSPLLFLVPGSSARVFCVALGALFAVAGITLTVRALRVAVVLDTDELRYTGFFASATIPRDAITTVLDDCTVEWRSADGRERRTALWVFRPAYVDDGTKFAPYWRWRRAGLLRVRQWAGARAV
ncbi:hypothetical protein [Curtobacterium sp. ZW137]|uniref:hypothetical protein n=1 Tax=Curtobacterium sp. ZW137 TaxID=2485104 RepID=UPI000F4CDE0B|nr:hypothetical protein [Curtobacterium sp. ZW137]ROP61163.1 hypothetical protein EDF55_3170 [Curtobacterium sp. ZW137]